MGLCLMIRTPCVCVPRLTLAIDSASCSHSCTHGQPLDTNQLHSSPLCTSQLHANNTCPVPFSPPLVFPSNPENKTKPHTHTLNNNNNNIYYYYYYFKDHIRMKMMAFSLLARIWGRRLRFFFFFVFVFFLKSGN